MESSWIWSPKKDFNEIMQWRIVKWFFSLLWSHEWSWTWTVILIHCHCYYDSFSSKHLTRTFLQSCCLIETSGDWICVLCLLVLFYSEFWPQPTGLTYYKCTFWVNLSVPTGSMFLIYVFPDGFKFNSEKCWHHIMVIILTSKFPWVVSHGSGEITHFQKCMMVIKRTM